MASIARRWRVVAGIGLTFALLLSACGSDAAAPPTDDGTTPDPSPTAPTPDPTDDDGDEPQIDRDATIRMAGPAVTGQWDPAAIPSEIAAIPFFSAVFDKLVHVDATGSPVPQIATSWETSDDGLTVAFELREGLTFHDGAPIDAEAVVANLERTRASDNPTAAIRFAGVESVEADGNTVVFALTEPNPLLVLNLASPVASIAGPASFDNIGTDPVGSGPYMVAATEADEVRLVRWDDYWDPESARVAEVVILRITDTAARVNAVRTGEIDFSYATIEVADQILALEGDPNAQVVRSEANNVVTLFLNIGMEPFDNSEVRKALQHAIDRDGINQGLLSGLCEPTTQIFWTGAGHLAELDDDYPFDPDLARSMLEAEGVTNLTVEGVLQPAGIGPAIIPAIQSQLADVGITLNVTQGDAVETRGRWRQGTYGMYPHQVNGLVDPGLQIIENVTAGDSPGGAPPEVSAAAERVLELEPGDPARDAALQDFARAYVADPVHVNICGFGNFFLAGNDVVGIEDMAFSNAAPFADWVRPLAKLAS